jgi:hypothetical protein
MGDNLKEKSKKALLKVIEKIRKKEKEIPKKKQKLKEEQQEFINEFD